MDFLIALYRAMPFRPHCNGSYHVLLCRLLKMNVPSMNDAIPHRSRCPAKGN